MTLQNNDRERAFGLIYRRPRYFLFSCDRSLQVLPNWRLRNQRQETGLSNSIVPGSLFLRGVRFLADFGHGARAAHLDAPAQEIRTSQMTRKLEWDTRTSKDAPRFQGRSRNS
jgi:hypothetical protein